MNKLLLVVCLLLATNGLAFHNWSVYHWHSDNLSPTVVDNTTSSLYDVSAGVEEWAALGTPIQPIMTTASKGDIVVKEAFSPFWLGLAQVYLDEDGHITKGLIKLNTRLLENYGPDVADHVFCQEVGHILGLEHNRFEFDTCMNDQTALTSTAPYPNLHDQDQLDATYNHVDDSVPDTGDGTKGGPPCSKKPDHPNCVPSGWVTVHTFWDL